MDIVIPTSNEQRKQTIDNLLEPHTEATYSFEIALSAVYFLVILQYKSEKVRDRIVCEFYLPQKVSLICPSL